LPILAFSQENKNIIGKDKMLHFGGGVLISEISYTPYYSGNWDFRTSTKVAFWGTLTASFYKEMADSYGQTGWSWQDIGYSMTGCILTIGVNYGIHKIRHRKKKKLITL